MSRYNQFTYKQLYVNNYCLLVATLARYFHSFGWLTGFYASKTRFKSNLRETSIKMGSHLSNDTTVFEEAIITF